MTTTAAAIAALETRAQTYRANITLGVEAGFLLAGAAEAFDAKVREAADAASSAAPLPEWETENGRFVWARRTANAANDAIEEAYEPSAEALREAYARYQAPKGKGMIQGQPIREDHEFSIGWHE